MSNTLPEESSSTDHELLVRWRAGDEIAATELHRRYCERLGAMAKPQIDSQLLGRFDTDDVVQSVFRTFFRRAREGPIPVDPSHSLRGLLTTITLNKIRNQANRHRAGKRDVACEVVSDGEQAHYEAISREPGPDEIAALAENAELLSQELKLMANEMAPRDAELLELYLQNKSIAETVAIIGCSRWTVRRVWNWIEKQLELRLE